MMAKDVLDNIDWAAFGRTALRPAQPRMDEVQASARSVVEEYEGRMQRSPRPPTTAAGRFRWMMEHGLSMAVWESATIGDDATLGWIDDDARVFCNSDREFSSVDRRVTGSFYSTPTSPELALALASNPLGVLTAEALAREIGTRLEPLRNAWGQISENVRVQRVAWRVLDPDRVFVSQPFSLGMMVSAGAVAVGHWEEEQEAAGVNVPRGFMGDYDTEPLEVARACVRAHRGLRAGGGMRGGIYRSARSSIMNTFVLAWSLWQFAISRGRTEVIRDRNIQFLPQADPTDPIMRLLGLGYMFFGIEAGVAHLAVPWRGAPVAAPTVQMMLASFRNADAFTTPPRAPRGMR